MFTAVTITLVAFISYTLGKSHKVEQADAILRRDLEEKADATALADTDIAEVIRLHTTRRPVVVSPKHRLLDDEDPLALYSDCGIVLSTH